MRVCVHRRTSRARKVINCRKCCGGRDDRYRAGDIDQIVVAGMMTSMCVDATVRAAVHLGFEATVVHDACAAPDLEFGGVSVPAEAVAAAFLAALADSYASVVSADQLLGD
ncbi:MAG TPA: isochorismatase family protein [Solirubrobacterales bacterium]|nr:isochorismatase family protein [Solirubrobacterales bacterium]